MSNKRTGPMPKRHPEMVRERSGGMCERCLVRPATEIHHRRFLSRGGKHNVANLIHLCGHGNADGCHGEAHTGIGDEVGTSIKAFNPRHESKIAFTDLLGREWLIDDDGGKEVDVGLVQSG